MSEKQTKLYGLKGAAVKQKLARREPVLCAGAWFTDPLLGELLGGLPLDVIVIDMEHGPWDITSVSRFLAATAGSDAAIVARPAEVNFAQIQLLLDLGIDGVMVAHCDDVATTKRLVEAVKYPPLGRRGIGPARPGAYLGDIPGYIARANDATLVWAQGERQVADADLAAMLQLPGVDALMVGPADMAASLGHLAQLDHPDVRKLIEQIVQTARRLGVPFGVPGAAPGEYPDQLIHLHVSDIGAIRTGILQEVELFKSTYPRSPR